MLCVCVCVLFVCVSEWVSECVCVCMSVCVCPRANSLDGLWVRPSIFVGHHSGRKSAWSLVGDFPVVCCWIERRHSAATQVHQLCWVSKIHCDILSRRAAQMLVEHFPWRQSPSDSRVAIPVKEEPVIGLPFRAPAREIQIPRTRNSSKVAKILQIGHLKLLENNEIKRN